MSVVWNSASRIIASGTCVAGRLISIEAAKGINITTDEATGAFVYKTFEAEERKYDDYMFYGPIPYSEILKYSNLKQNEGWK